MVLGDLMEGVKIDVPFKREASRIELFVRIGYLIVYYFVALVISIAFMITWPLQVLSILIRGKRSQTLQRVNQMYVVYYTEFMIYFYTLTDERPPLFPKY